MFKVAKLRFPKIKMLDDRLRQTQRVRKLMSHGRQESRFSMKIGS